MYQTNQIYPNLTVTILQARLPSCTGLFSSTSSQVEIIYPPQSIKTSTAEPIESNHYWGETFNFELNLETIHFKIHQKQILFKDTLIGSASIKTEKFSGWVNIEKNNLIVGSIRICIEIDDFEGKFKNFLNYRLGPEILFKEFQMKNEKKNLDFFECGKNFSKSENFGKFLEDEEKLKNEIEKFRKMSQELNSKLNLLGLQETILNQEREKIKLEWDKIGKSQEIFRFKRKKILKLLTKISSEKYKLENDCNIEDLQENISVSTIPLSTSKPNVEFQYRKTSESVFSILKPLDSNKCI